MTCMLVAGEPSGDQLAAELVRELRRMSPSSRFFGAGGAHLAAEGVDLVLDLTKHSVIGLVEVLRKYGEFRRFLRELVALAVERRPELVVGIDYGGFNLRLARALRAASRDVPGWYPKIVQFVSPQVWASRPGRAQVLAENHDLLLSILPFEKAWYARKAPKLRVEFVGHPLVDRHRFEDGSRSGPVVSSVSGGRPEVVLLPGSRPGELRRHWPVVAAAARIVASQMAVRMVAVLPNEDLAREPRATARSWPELEVQVGGLSTALQTASLALASTGTVTLECAWFRVPTLAYYRTSWSTYQIGKRIVTVPYLAMPNLLADEAVMPEFIQDDFTPSRLSSAALELLRDPGRRVGIQQRLGRVVAQLGEPGAARRAAGHVLNLLTPPPASLPRAEPNPGTLFPTRLSTGRQ